MSGEEERLWRAYLLGAYGQKMGLDALMEAVSSPERFDAAVETREERLERLLTEERRKLRELRAARHTPEDFAPVVDWDAA